MRLHTSHFVLASSLLMLLSCNEGQKSGERGPIVLGDPATIVTETDSQFLRDQVLDFTPKQRDTTPVAVTTEAITSNPANADTPTQQQETVKEEKPVAEKGLKVDLGGVTVVITGIEARGSGTSYQLTSGSLTKSKLQFTEGDIDEVSQRYVSVAIAENSLGKLVLEDIDELTSWKPIKGSNNTFTVTGLEENKLVAPKFSSSTLKRAITRASRRMRLSRSSENKWQNSLRRVRTANQKPMDVKLRTVMWKIEGKTSNGRPFNKQLRIDIPV